jgi:hypothetical protein
MRTIKTLLTLISLCLAVGVQAAPEAGDKVSSELKIESDRGLKRIPLPEGEWTILSVTTPEGTPKFGGSKANKFTQVIAAQPSNGSMALLLYVSVNATSEVPKYTDELCKPLLNGRFSEDRYIADVWEQACMQVAHSTEFLGVSGANKPPWSNVRSELRKRGWSYPNTVIGLQYRRYDQRGQWLTYRIYVNPTMLGFPDFDGKWADAPWHMDFLARDPKRLALMKALLQQAKDVQKTLDEYFLSPTDKSPKAGFTFKLTGN